MRRTMILAWLTVIGWVCGSTKTAQGWTEGHRIRPTTLPVVYHLDESRVEPEAGGPGAEAAEQALRRAVAAWSAAGSRWHGEVGPRVNGEDPDRSVVGWSTEWTWSPAVIGVASPGRGSSGVTFNIVLNAEHYMWVGEGIRLRGRVYPLDATLMFLIGAGLGLGVSDERQALMRSDGRYTSLQPDDITGIRALYPPPPCGDGTAEHPEECDDGNQTDGDGCDSECRQEDPPPMVDAGLPMVTDGGILAGASDAGEMNRADASATPLPDESALLPGDGGGSLVPMPLGPTSSTEPGPGWEARRVEDGCAAVPARNQKRPHGLWVLWGALGMVAAGRTARRVR